MSSLWKPSVTVAAVISRTLDGVQQFLLVEEHTPEGLKLNNPAGHLDPEESPQQGVAREVLEETTCRFVPECL
ncbi:MAG: NUDIX domain-containing protein, partial [Pseudorhodobacter sp.]|nr:NUDIX domain-containing protein [Rhizobacter sp.]